MAEKKAFLLRISPDLWVELNRWAGDELRSVNGQIEYILKRAVEDRKRGSTVRPKGSAPGALEGSPPEPDEHP